MPSDALPLVVTSGLGVSVLAGVVSGICYVVIQGYRSSRTPKTSKGKYGVTNPWQCCICGAHFRQTSTGGAGGTGVVTVRRCTVCAGCDGHACRATCGEWLRDAWLCKQCVRVQTQPQEQEQHHTRNRSWFRGILTALQPDTVSVRMSSSQETASGEGSGGGVRAVQSAREGPNDEKEVVRDFIERLVGAMLGADLDDTSVGRIYVDSEYDAMFDRYHGDISTALTDLGSALHISIANLPVTGQTPCTAHASLKNIIRRVLRDASNMAILKSPQNESEAPETTTNRTYEDLLATAILNKVIDNYQTDLRRSSSGSGSSKKSDSSRKHHKNKRHDEGRWRAGGDRGQDVDTTSVSSVEEWCRSESSCGSKYVDHMSFTIQQSIEEITTSDDDNTSISYLHSHNLSKKSNKHSDKDTNSLTREDWQDNWLFSRKGKGSPKPVPVPMLVPNPSTDYRALIGDRDAEDTSDLSETGSDIEDLTDTQDIKTILVESRTVIGGKNLLENISPLILEPEIVKDAQSDNEEEVVNTQEEVIVENQNRIINDDDDEVSEARNNTLIHEVPYVESDSLGSNTEKDMEYTEKYASFPRQISKNKSPVPSPRQSKDSLSDEQRDELVVQSNGNISHDEIDKPSEDEIVGIEPSVTIRGSYSEKEKEKWKNPVALANNPYSKENLDKRLRNKSEIDDNYTFGRDYYIREAKKAAGGRKKFSDDSWSESSRHDFDRQQSLPVTTQKAYERSHSADQNVFVAVPAVVNEDVDTILEENELQETEDESRTRPTSLALSTDSEDVDVKRIYNIETGQVHTYKTKDFTKEVIQGAKSPVGSKYGVKPNVLVSSNLADETDNKFDENHNETYENKLNVANSEPVMNILKINHLISATIDVNNTGRKGTVSKQEFLQQQISVEEPEIIMKKESVFPEQMRDVSKKYLQSLVKNSNKAPIKIMTTPPISLQEYSNEDEPQSESTNALIDLTPDTVDYMNNTPPISLQENCTDNLTETDECEDKLYKNYQSCMDLSLIEQDQILNRQSLNSFAVSTPNLAEEKQYHPENDSDGQMNGNKTNDLDELSNMAMPSVSDLKKLFDKNKEKPKGVILRTKSHLTTKPEFRAHRQQIHSLTARSLSTEFRKELQNDFPARHDIITQKNGVNAEENKNSEQEELKVIPPCKSKIQFFELLRNNSS